MRKNSGSFETVLTGLAAIVQSWNLRFKLAVKNAPSSLSGRLRTRPSKNRKGGSDKLTIVVISGKLARVEVYAMEC